VTSLSEIKREVLKRVKPTREEEQRVWRVVNRVDEKAEEAARELGVEALIEVEGSIAKGTWIRGDKDLDVFIILPREMGRESLKTVGLEIARRAAGEKWLESYAEHPYIEAEIEGFKVDIVPCLRVEKAEEKATAVDRTPFHTRYVKEHLTEEQKDEVRVLKQFLKGIGAYGAEIKVGGFSGYLCELLVIKYGSFERLVEEVADWKPPVVIDIEGHYDSPRKAVQVFEAPLIVVDPVDRRRNVAAALTEEKLCTCIAASRRLLEKPSLNFCWPPPREIPFQELIKMVEDWGSHLAALRTGCPRVASEVLWGQLKKSLRGIEKLLETYGFAVLDARAWSNEREEVVFLFELEKVLLPRGRVARGPPIYKREEEKRFHESSRRRILAGPWIADGRWRVFEERSYVDARRLLEEKVFSASLGELIREELQKRREVLIDAELEKLYREVEEFREELADFVVKKPRWL